MKTNRYLIIASVVAALLFGFDTAVISGAMPFLQEYFHLNDISLGWTVSSLLVGCIFGVITAGRSGDRFGRKRTLMAAAIAFFISAIGSALATGFTTFIAFRFAGGLAVGTASMLSPMYISEIAPAKVRGRLVSLNQLAIVVGILVAFFSNYLLAGTGENNWRWMLAVMGLPALLFFFALFAVPESPRWLVLKGRNDEAMDILTKINDQPQASLEMENIQRSVQLDKTGTLLEVFAPKIRPVLWLGIALAIFSQTVGINAIMYYAPLIFQKTGSGIDSALMQTILIGGTNLVFTVVAIGLIDRLGRRPLLIMGTVGMAIALSIMAYAFLTNATTGYLLIISVLLYIASFAVSLGPVVWVYIAEIFPNSIRSMAMAVCTVTVWIACFVVTLAFPVMLNRLGGGISFLVFDAVCLLLFLFLMFRVPETKGRSLEELEKDLYKIEAP
jgi:MFS transporter, SP family, arabinose:H+ symporter